MKLISNYKLRDHWYIENIVVSQENPIFPKILYHRSKREVLISIFANPKSLMYDIKYGIFGGFFIIRILTCQKTIGDIYEIKKIEIETLKNYISFAMRRLTYEIGIKYARKVTFTPLFILYDLLVSYRSIIGFIDPINIYILSNLNIVAENFIKKFLLYSKFLENCRILCREKKGFFKICDEFIESIRRRKKVFIERALRELIVPYMEYVLRVRNVASFLALSKVRAWPALLHIPTPYSELYIKVNDEMLPFHRGFKEVEFSRNLGSIINYTFLGYKKINERKVAVVVKKYRDWKSLKWLPVGLWTSGIVDFALTASERLLREVNAIYTLSRSNIRVPKIYGINWEKKYIIREYVPGNDVAYALRKGDTLRPNVLVGRLLAKIHKLGFSMGDTRPSNFILKNDTIVPIDLEQASSTIPRAWDLAEYIAFTATHLGLKIKATCDSVLSLIRGYLEGRGNPKVLCELGKTSFIRVLMPISPIYPFIAKKIQKEFGCAM